MVAAVLVVVVCLPSLDLIAAAPARGLSKLRGGPLSIGYLNAIRSGVGTTSQNMAALNYEAIDIILGHCSYSTKQ